MSSKATKETVITSSSVAFVALAPERRNNEDQLIGSGETLV
jgi:hypothetical protein